jgi:pimeloyl-ACP methyl ester carboxylesterase
VPLHADVDDAVSAILRAAAATGCAALVVASTGEEAAAWRARGVSGLIAVSTALVHSALFSAVRALAPDRAPPGPVPLLLLPGMLGDETLWSEVVVHLDGRVPVESARIDLDDSVPEMADTVLATAPPLFALAGHSLGGIVALEIVRRAPGRVARLALLNSSARPAAPAQHEAWAAMRTRTETGAFADVAVEFARACLPAARRSDPALVGRGEAMAARVGPLGLLRQLAAQATRPDSGPSLVAIDVPVLVVSGADDEVAPPVLQEELAASLRGADHVVLDGVGHMSPLEAPEAVAQAIGRWLEA